MDAWKILWRFQLCMVQALWEVLLESHLDQLLCVCFGCSIISEHLFFSTVNRNIVHPWVCSLPFIRDGLISSLLVKTEENWQFKILAFSFALRVCKTIRIFKRRYADRFTSLALDKSTEHHWKLTSSRHNIRLKNCWVCVKQQSLTHLIGY